MLASIIMLKIAMQIYEVFCYHTNSKQNKLLTALNTSYSGKTFINVIRTFIKLRR